MGGLIFLATVFRGGDFRLQKNNFKAKVKQFNSFVISYFYEKNKCVSFYFKEIQGSKCVVLTIRLIKIWETGPYVFDGTSDTS